MKRVIMYISRKCLYSGLALLFAVVARADTFRVVVEAGSTLRRATPVSVDLDLADSAKSSATVTHGSSRAPAQIEDLGEGKARVHWIVDQLPAGESREYTVVIDSARGEQTGFSWHDSSKAPERSTELRLGDRSVLRYMHTAFDPKNIELTKKVFHHVYSPDGSRLITKGPGGLYPHHRGIYFGYKCKVGDQTYDIWHCHKGEHQNHEAVVKSHAGPVFGGHTLKIRWNGIDGKTFLEETRTLLAFRQPDGQTLIEFRSTLQATVPAVELEGDPQHAGVQFRASQEVAENKNNTRYLRPEKWKDLAAGDEVNENVDLPWNAIQFDVGGEGYTVAYLSDPANPTGAKFSERLYGRFGEFFPWKLRPDNPLSVRYRWWVRNGRDVTREAVEEKYADLAEPPKVSLKK